MTSTEAEQTLTKWQRPADAARPRARGLLLTVLGEYVLASQEPVFTRAFLRAFEALGVAEGAARKALLRSAEAGWLDTDRVGRETRWCLTERLRARLSEGAERIYSFGLDERAAGDAWLLLQVTVPESDRSLRDRLRTRLGWLGFGPLGQGLWIAAGEGRQAELDAALDELRLQERSLTFDCHPRSPGERERMVRQAWQLDSLNEAYERFLEDFGSRSPTGEKGSFVALTEMVHRWRAFPLIDPQLPIEDLPSDWPGQRAARLFHRRRGSWSPKARAWWRSLS